MGVVRAENSDYSKNDSKNTEKGNKFTSPRVGLDGDGVVGKTSPATKVGPKICKTSIHTFSHRQWSD